VEEDAAFYIPFLETEKSSLQFPHFSLAAFSTIQSRDYYDQPAREQSSRPVAAQVLSPQAAQQTFYPFDLAAGRRHGYAVFRIHNMLAPIRKRRNEK